MGIRLRKGAVLTAALCLLAGMAAPKGAALAGGDIREVTLRVLAVRVGSGFTPGAVIDTLHEGDRVTVLVRENEEGLAKVRTASGEVGMAPACFLRPVYDTGTPVKEEAGETVSGTGVVTAAAVNFRQSPAIDTENLLSPLYKDMRVTLLNREGFYYKVAREDGLVGYVPVRYVARVTQEVDEPQVPTGGAVEPEPEPEPEPVVCTVIAQALRMRETPSAASAQIGRLVRGQRVTLVEERADFCLVRTDDGLEGWAATKYLEIDYPEAKAPKPGAADVFFALTERVNFRSSPQIRDDNRIGKLEPGTVVRFVEEAGDFWKVETADGRTGYCAKEYLRATGETFG